MRFVLDHDVDVAVCAVLTAAGHDCWRAPEGLAPDGRDDDISVYADDMNAVVVSHDAEFARRRRNRTFGQHVYLRCGQADATDVLGQRADELFAMLIDCGEGVFSVSRKGVIYSAPRWR